MATISTRIVLTACAAILLQVAPAAAQDANFAGKTLSIYSGTSAGGATTTYARILASSIGKHLPGNPTTVVKLMPGGTGLVLANWLHDVAPRDGLSIAIFTSALLLEPLIAPTPSIKFDSRRFYWLGSMGTQYSVCFTWHASQVRTIADAKRLVATVGASSSSSPDASMPAIANAVAGTKFKVINGYSGNDIFLAMERGEVDGRCGISWDSLKAERADWLKDGKINMLAQFALSPLPGLEKVPLLSDLVTDPKDRQALELYFAPGAIGRPFGTTPDVPAERAKLLREAFAKAMKDPELLAQAEKAHLDLSPLSGEDTAAIVEKMYSAPPDIVQRVAKFKAGGGAGGK